MSAKGKSLQRVISKQTDPTAAGLGVGLTPELADRLVHAIERHPTARLAAASCGVTYGALSMWLSQGTLPSAPEWLQSFTLRALAAEAKLGARVFGEFLASTSEGEGKSAGHLMRFMTTRFPHMEKDLDLSMMVDSKSADAGIRAKLLKQPPPSMRHELNSNGWEQVTEEERAALLEMRRSAKR